ncbi:hypothetical protein AVEN_274554-1 [Araneus ventricosus]|uniref:Uncharacterized protein n=1 Tax=Araneus ventricosus TaxID=182803 RepID=A0A4Y2JHC5_ARAVE|nr:hypothetical protein AVEN_274554-1 [Araneus ventricosus]
MVNPFGRRDDSSTFPFLGITVAKLPHHKCGNFAFTAKHASLRRCVYRRTLPKIRRIFRTFSEAMEIFKPIFHDRSTPKPVVDVETYQNSRGVEWKVEYPTLSDFYHSMLKWSRSKSGEG